MNRSRPLAAATCVAALAASFVWTAGAAAGELQGAQVFSSRCAVCHGPEAAGIPGAFPPLREQVVTFAKSAEGRDYLAMVVTTGLMGTLKIGGTSYLGVMPAQSGLTEADIAAVLTYLASGRDKLDDAAALTAADVVAARARHADKTPQATRALRPAYPES